MTVSNQYDPTAIKQEIAYFLRNKLYDDDPQATQRLDTDVSTASGNDSQTEFVFNYPTAYSVISVEYPVSTILTYGTDYTINPNYTDGGVKKLKVTFTSAPASGTNNIRVTALIGTNWIFPDFDKVPSQLSKFPQVRFDIISMSSTDEDLEGATKENNALLSIVVYDYKTERIDDMIKIINKEFLDAHKSFYNFKYARKIGVGPLINDPKHNDKLMHRNIDFSLPFNYEVVS